MASTKSKEKREAKEIKKRKVILGQTTLNRRTHTTERGKRCRDELNNTTKSQLQSPELVARVTRRWWSD